jgi:hypothetical protein
MEIQTIAESTHALQVLAIAAILFAAYVSVQRIYLNSHIQRLPAFHNAISSEAHRKQYLKSAKRLYREGYEKVNANVVLSSYWTDELKFKNSVWRVTSADGFHQVVISPSLLPELRKLPESVLSIEKAVEQFLAVK